MKVTNPILLPFYGKSNSLGFVNRYLRNKFVSFTLYFDVNLEDFIII